MHLGSFQMDASGEQRIWMHVEIHLDGFNWDPFRWMHCEACECILKVVWMDASENLTAYDRYIEDSNSEWGREIMQNLKKPSLCSLFLPLPSNDLAAFCFQTFRTLRFIQKDPSGIISEVIVHPKSNINECISRFAWMLLAWMDAFTWMDASSNPINCGHFGYYGMDASGTLPDVSA